jgi:hypothetical protein
LVRAYSACCDLGHKEILTPQGAPGEAPQHGDLANVGERIGDWALEEPFR